MAFKKNDFEIFHDLNFDIQPVGVKYHSSIPEGMDRSTQKMALCEMLKTAQGG